MIRRFELTISPNYVKDWTYLEGVREFFQNAVDESSHNPDHPMSYKYSPSEEDDNGVLIIRNANSHISINTLLLGETSKNDNSYIGSFGEGYKIALLVLLRSGKKVNILNGHDEWRTSLINSRKYGCKIPRIEIEEEYSLDNEDFIVRIEGITFEEYTNIVNNNLMMKESISKIGIIHTNYGSVLTDKSEVGRIYVGGLYVCSKSELYYGYDLLPESVYLNRDRNMINNFDIVWNTSKILAHAFKSNASELIRMIDNEDASQIDTFLSSDQRSDIRDQFYQKHPDMIPVSNQSEYEYFKSKGMTPILISTKLKSILGAGKYDDEYREYNSRKNLYTLMKEALNDTDRYLAVRRTKDLIEDYSFELMSIMSKGDK